MAVSAATEGKMAALLDNHVAMRRVAMSSPKYPEFWGSSDPCMIDQMQSLQFFLFVRD